MADGSQGRNHQRNKLKLVRQTEVAECGLACLVMMANYFGHDMDLPAVRHQFGTSMKGASLVRLIQVAGHMGLEVRPLRAELEYLSELQGPAIAHWDHAHFVVIHRVTAKGAEIFDPARGHLTMPMAEVSKHFTGILLEASPHVDFTPTAARRRITLRGLLGRVTGLKRSAAQTLTLAVAIELLALLLPYQAQWVLDSVLVTEDSILLWTIGACFLVVVGMQMALTVARAYLITWLGASLSSQWITNLFRHLLSLPLGFFQRRHMGDVVSRFNSIHIMQNVLTASFAEALLDGATGILTVVILTIYSPSLTLVVGLAVAVYGAVRWAAYRHLRLINEEQIIYGARQNSELMESIRGIQAIKLGVRSAERSSRLSSATMESCERDMRSQRIGLIFNAVNQGLFSLLRVVIITVAAWQCMQGGFTAGMLVAFVAYADRFGQKLGGLVDKSVDLAMLRMHAERVADIALEEPEANLRGTYRGENPDADIEVRGLSFRYGPDEPWIFRDLNFRIQQGEYVAITGRSGCGKSTLAKVLLGLLPPTEGTVMLGGIDVRKLGLERYRLLVGSVMQDDQLFAGSIAQNIAFFEPEADVHKVHECAKHAMIDEEIRGMPMGYETLVGDMGSSLSGGQKQRVLIARALFNCPRILVLDEATSHLDSAGEHGINDAVGHLNMTRITIAHRPDTIASADRVLNLGFRPDNP